MATGEATARNEGAEQARLAEQRREEQRRERAKREREKAALGGLWSRGAPGLVNADASEINQVLIFLHGNSPLAVPSRSFTAPPTLIRLKMPVCRS